MREQGIVTPENEIEPETFSLKDGLLDINSRWVTQLDPTAQVDMLQLEHIPERLRGQIDLLANEIYGPTEDLAHFAKQRVPHYRIGSVVETQITPEDSNRTLGIMFMAGAYADASKTFQVTSELFRQAQGLFEDRKIGFAANVSSSASTETANRAFPQSTVDRAAYQAVLVIEYLKDHPTKELLLIGQSIGASDLVVATPLIQELLDINGIDTTIKGLVLVQPGSMFDQSTLRFVKATPQVMNRSGITAELDPSDKDLADLRMQISQAMDRRDYSSADQLRSRLDRLTRNKSKLPYLNLAEKASVEYHDQMAHFFEERGDKGLVKMHKKDRSKVIKKAITRIGNGAATEQSQPLYEVPLSVARGVRQTATLATGILAPWRKDGRVTRTLSQERRDAVTIPIAYIFGEKDEWFPASLAEEQIPLQQLETNEESQIVTIYSGDSRFANSESTLGAKSFGLPHEELGYDPNHFASTVLYAAQMAA